MRHYTFSAHTTHFQSSTRSHCSVLVRSFLTMFALFLSNSHRVNVKPFSSLHFFASFFFFRRHITHYDTIQMSANEKEEAAAQKYEKRKKMNEEKKNCEWKNGPTETICTFVPFVHCHIFFVLKIQFVMR